ncbi:MAG: hypothetical protein HKN45_04300 [Flavobacteriales bacterium]|nr:hypothetical protein [Flavobacteriales bacterium]
MEQWKRWHRELLFSLEDIRLEVVVSELMMGEHIKEEEVFFSPNGGFHRIVDNDIAALHAPGKTTRKTDRAFFEVNRKGIYDGLPESVFHQSRTNKSFRTLSEIKSEMAYQNRVEEDARTFFSPLDHEIIYMKCLIEINERRKTSDILSSTKEEGLKKFWEIPNMFNEKERGRLMLLLPLSYRISSSLDLAAQAMKTVLDIDIDITEEVMAFDIDDDSASMRLGHRQLGVDILTSGADDFTDKQLIIKLGPMGIVEASNYAPGQLGATKMSYLAEYFLPADRFYHLDILIQEEEQFMELNDEGSYTRLGVSTILN